jgi:hypothetical protein
MMRTTQYLILALVFFVLFNQSYAQTPIIDSVSINESKGELFIYGSSLNDSTAIVTADTTILPILSYSQKRIITSIPPEGPGSAGPINVTINGAVSNTKTITYWHYRYDACNYYIVECPNGDGAQQITSSAQVYIRFDEESLQPNAKRGFSPVLLSTYWVYDRGGHGYNSRGYCFYYSGCNCSRGDTVRGVISYSKSERIFHFEGNNGISVPDVHLNKNYYVEGYDEKEGEDCYYKPGKFAHITPQSTWFAPPSLTVSNSLFQEKNISVELSENPVVSRSSARINVPYEGMYQTEIYDILGNLYSHNTVICHEGLNMIELNVASLPKGLYTYRVANYKFRQTVKFIKG